eukprot:3438528-Pyramimonas_sp.AAC.1
MYSSMCMLCSAARISARAGLRAGLPSRGRWMGHLGSFFSQGGSPTCRRQRAEFGRRRGEFGGQRGEFRRQRGEFGRQRGAFRRQRDEFKAVTNCPLSL